MGNAVPRIHHRHEATAPSSGATTTALVPSGRRHGRKAARDTPVRRPRVAAEDERKPEGGTNNAVITVKVVVTRKEAERLIARLEEHNAKERKARIADITRRLRAGDGGGSGGSPAAACGGARTPPRLATIQEV
ncbi:hypothetical protein QYE76_054600 [Lolium multiflorum]|uniref:Uncharacterized protein n=1 Tax=Lolium multiflorum TaxID=4521 RepID=A0AAD8SZF4_LOLMU|nr:hypothetical protein QYE76_054600 [Lolium multiflorum]